MKEHTKFRMVTETELLGHLKKNFLHMYNIERKKKSIGNKIFKCTVFLVSNFCDELSKHSLTHYQLSYQKGRFRPTPGFFYCP